MDLISIIIPVANRVNRLVLQCKQLEKLAAENHEHDFEFIFVDDGSHRESTSKITELTQIDKRFRLVVLTRDFGETAAFIAGAAYASGDCVGYLRGKNLDPAMVFGELIDHWHAGTRIVLGKWVNPGPHSWRWRGVTLSDPKLPRRIFPQQIYFQDISSLLVDKEVNYILSQISDPFSELLEILAWTGIDPILVEYEWQIDELNAKRYRFRHRSISLNYTKGAFSASSLRTYISLGLVLAMLGVLITAGLIIANEYYSGDIQDWWMLTGVVILMVGVEFVLMGMFGEQIYRSLEKIRSRPTFVVDMVINPPVTSSEQGREKIEKMILSLWNVRKQKNIYASAQHSPVDDIPDQE
jgi:glycosyltransferase involved in cell wall biosynthesis